MAEGAVTTPRAVPRGDRGARIAVIDVIVLIFETCVCRARVSAGVRRRGRAVRAWCSNRAALTRTVAEMESGDR